MRVRRAATVLLMTLALVGCSTSVEQQQLSQFFYACRLRDLTALSKLSTVVFEPAVDGIVTGFDITSSSGDAVRRTVSISAPVKLPDGRTQTKAFTITIEHGVVTAISGRSGSPSTPPS
jgi:hypothetical protein